MTSIRRIYQLHTNDPTEINLLLSQLAERLDQIEGYRGTPTFQAAPDLNTKKLTNIGAATGLKDALSGEVAWGIGAVYLTTTEAAPAVGTWEQEYSGDLFGTGTTIYAYKRTA